MNKLRFVLPRNKIPEVHGSWYSYPTRLGAHRPTNGRERTSVCERQRWTHLYGEMRPRLERFRQRSYRVVHLTNECGVSFELFLFLDEICTLWLDTRIFALRWGRLRDFIERIFSLTALV